MTQRNFFLNSFSGDNSNLTIRRVTEPFLHSEGPHWDSDTSTLYFCDTFKATVYRWKINEGKLNKHKIEGRNSVGIIIPLRNEKNKFVVGADRILYKGCWNDHLELEEINMVHKSKPKNQLNDGKADADGRIWIGTLERNQDLSVSPNGGALFAIERGNITEKLQNVSIGNGLAWSKDNKKFYYIDSTTKKIDAYDFDLQTGNIANRKEVFDIAENKFEGIPDGMTIDENDNLWIALFGGHGIIQVDSRTGKLQRYIKMPVSYVTSVTFGGPKLDVLYVTSSRLHLDEEGMKREPDAGAIFTIEGLGVKGLPANTAVLK